MTTKRHTLCIAVSAAILATPFAAAAGPADAPNPNDGMRYLSVDALSDKLGNQQVLSTLSLPVGRSAWVQAGVGKARNNAQNGGQRPGIFTGAVGVAGESYQLTVNTAQRFDGSRFRQQDWGSSLDWKHGGSSVGVDLAHRRARTSGTTGASAVPTQTSVSGTGFGGHGVLRLSEHVSVYGAATHNHYKTSVQQAAMTPPGGLLSGNPLLGQVLFGGVSAVNIDEVALDHSAQVGTTYRWSKVAVSAEYTTGQVHDNGGAMHSVDVKAAVDVAPGWRVASGVGRSSSQQSGQATFALVSAAYGW